MAEEFSTSFRMAIPNVKVKDLLNVYLPAHDLLIHPLSYYRRLEAFLSLSLPNPTGRPLRT